VLASLLALTALSWPLLGLPLDACEVPSALRTSEAIETCALAPLAYLFAIWVALIALLAWWSRAGRAAPPEDEE
jgi:hypothetical protein